MGEREAMEEAPAWYVDLLLEGLRAEHAAQVSDVGGGALVTQGPPDTLSEWR